LSRDTSIEAYRTIKANGLLSKRRLQVYEYLFNHGPATAKEIFVLVRCINKIKKLGGPIARESTR